MTVPHSGRNWRLAPALIAMEAEADRIAPRRRRTSDGSIGDRSHRNRDSDHNPKGGWVDALDLSHDPPRFDAHAHARNIVARRDPRLEYVISNRRIWSAARAREGWRPYSGVNPHTMHAHFVVKDSHRHDRSPWFSASVVLPTPPVNPQPQPLPEPEVEAVKPRRRPMILCKIRPEQAQSGFEKSAVYWSPDLIHRYHVPNPDILAVYQLALAAVGLPSGITLISRAFMHHLKEVK